MVFREWSDVVCRGGSWLRGEGREQGQHVVMVRGYYALGCLLLLGVVTVRRGVKVCCLCGWIEPEAAVQ